MTREQVELIRVRIMSEAYDLADRNDSEGYNSVKVMCGEVLELIGLAVAAEREACAKVCEDAISPYVTDSGGMKLVTLALAAAIRKRGEVKP